MRNSQLISWGKFLIGWPLSVISLFFIFKIVIDKSSKLNISLNEINFFYIFLALITFFIYYLLRSFLWSTLLREKGHSVSFKKNTYLFTFSELKRYAPGNIWSFLGRAHQFTKIGIPKKTVSIAIISDIQLVIIGSVLASIPAIYWLLDSPKDLQTKIFALLPLSFITVIVYFLATAFLYKKSEGGKFINSLFLPGYDNNSKIKLILVSLATYFIFGVGNYFAMLSVHFLDFSNLIYLSSFFTFSLLLGYLSFITPMGLGVREGVATLGLMKIMSVIDAGFISLFTRIVLIISELTFLVLVLIWEKLPLKK